MKESLATRMGFIGAGVGLALFAVFGLLPGAFLGGVLGLNMANLIFGAGAVPSLLPRILIVIGMLTGVMVAGLVFLAAGGALGWLVGLATESVKAARARAHDKAGGLPGEKR
ncbi:MAG: hypothetical protein P8Y66_06780 [Nitrospirota bacterium]|jgi:uncharacterized membrane protein